MSKKRKKPVIREVRAELQGIMSNDWVKVDWRRWRPVDPTNVLHSFTLDIGPEGEDGSNLFQVVVATRKGLHERMRKGKFRGFVVDAYDPDALEPMFKQWISEKTGSTWEEVAGKLCDKAYWEFEDYRG